MDTVAEVIVVVEFAKWCLHYGSTLVECTANYNFLTDFIHMALFACYYVLVLR